jgi:nitrogen fixation NifU-like protein
MDLYSPIIKQLNASPANYGEMESPDHDIRAINQFCGDKFIVHLNYNGKVTDVSFDGYGCAVSKASADILADNIRGLGWVEIRSLCEHVIKFLDGHLPLEDLDPRLESFSVVSKYPGRYECAALVWKEMLAYATANTLN